MSEEKQKQTNNNNNNNNPTKGTIWDSRKDEPINKHPLLMAVLEVAIANFDEFLSRCYAKVGGNKDDDLAPAVDADDHNHNKRRFTILENLTGKFSLGFSTENPKSYSYTVETNDEDQGDRCKGIGICFNESLVKQSTRHVMRLCNDKGIKEQLKTKICFNEALVQQSTQYVMDVCEIQGIPQQLEKNDPTTPREEINSIIEIDGTMAAYAAILQQSLEDEICKILVAYTYSKNHQRDNDNNDKLKPNEQAKDYVKGEAAGYDAHADVDAVQAAEAETISCTTSTHSNRQLFVNAQQQPAVQLVVNPRCSRGNDRNKWFRPAFMKLRRGVLFEDNNEYDSKFDLNNTRPLTLDDIKKYMEYPTKKKDGPTRNDVDVKFEPPPDDEGSGRGRGRGRRDRKRDREDDDDNDDNDDQGTDSDSRWFRSVQDQVNQAVKDVIVNQIAKERAVRDTTFETTTDGYDPTWEWYPDEDEEATNFELQKQCKVSVRFLDAERNGNKASFDESEDILAAVAIKNQSTTENVYFETCSGTSFGRSGLDLEINGIRSGYIVSGGGPAARVTVSIRPGKSYTFIRKFTNGGEKIVFCKYQTPPPGTYTTQVCYRGHVYPEKFDFVVSSEDETTE